MTIRIEYDDDQGERFAWSFPTKSLQQAVAELADQPPGSFLEWQALKQMGVAVDDLEDDGFEHTLQRGGSRLPDGRGWSCTGCPWKYSYDKHALTEEPLTRDYVHGIWANDRRHWKADAPTEPASDLERGPHAPTKG